jgi:hypothetical protein
MYRSTAPCLDPRKLLFFNLLDGYYAGRPALVSTPTSIEGEGIKKAGRGLLRFFENSASIRLIKSSVTCGGLDHQRVTFHRCISSAKIDFERGRRRRQAFIATECAIGHN